MQPLKELDHTRQVPGEPRRRWFFSPDVDLIVWLDDADTLIGFQLCYEKAHGERALTWRADRGYDHSGVDDGEAHLSAYKQSPILVADGRLNRARVSEIFHEASDAVPEGIRTAIADLIDKAPE
jgi:hypothetical protein